MFAIKIVGLATGHESRFDGTFVRRFDPDARDGIGELFVTRHIGEARHFPDPTEALELWRAQSTVRPIRHDGKPNRPLTAFTVELVRL
jgi:hypothetical protein